MAVIQWVPDFCNPMTRKSGAGGSAVAEEPVLEEGSGSVLIAGRPLELDP